MKKKQKKPDVFYTLQKTACRYLYLYRNGERKKSGHNKKNTRYNEGILIAYVKITHLIINASLQTQGKGHNLKIPQVAISEGEVIRGIFLFSLIQIEYDVKMYKQTNQEIHILIFDSHNTNTILKNPTNVYIR